MPSVKPAALLKVEALAQVGGFLANVPNGILRANKILTEGLPFNPQTGAPALSPAEIAEVVNPDLVAFIKGSAALAEPADPATPAS